VVDTPIQHFGISKLVGLGLMLVAFTQPHLCFRAPPKAFRLFAGYVAVYVLLGLSTIADPQKTGLAREILIQLSSLIQLLVFFWIANNLLCAERVRRHTLLTLAFSCIVLAGLIAVGAASDRQGDRASTFGENPNLAAIVFSIGLMALVGLAYGRRSKEKKLLVLAWVAGPLLLVTAVRTGSRGALVALLLALCALVIKPHAIRENLKAAFMVLAAVTILAWASYQIETVRERWERTLEEGDLAGREQIYETAIEMILDSPFVGWGPVYHLYELGYRLGVGHRDPHNLYLWVLGETGILGSVFFFGGLCSCFSSAWKGRKASEGVVPLVMLVFLLVVNLKGSHMDKFFWLVLAYIVAAGAHRSVGQRWSRSLRRGPVHRFPRTKEITQFCPSLPSSCHG
jgi:O-antigen ligase